MPRPGGEPGIFLWFSFIFSLKQRLRPLGYCAPLKQLKKVWMTNFLINRPSKPNSTLPEFLSIIWCNVRYVLRQSHWRPGYAFWAPFVQTTVDMKCPLIVQSSHIHSLLPRYYKRCRIGPCSTNAGSFKSFQVVIYPNNILAVRCSKALQACKPGTLSRWRTWRGWGVINSTREY